MTQNGFSALTLCPTVNRHFMVSGMLFYRLTTMQNRWAYPDPATEPISHMTERSMVKVLKRRLLLQTVLLQMVLLPSGYQLSSYAAVRKASISYMRFAVHVVILAWIDDVPNGELYFNNQIAALRKSGAGDLRLKCVFAVFTIVFFILLLLSFSVKFFFYTPGIMNHSDIRICEGRYAGYMAKGSMATSIYGFFIDVIYMLFTLIMLIHRVSVSVCLIFFSSHLYGYR